MSTTEIKPPKKRRDKKSRQMARRIRDSHWEFMERVAKAGTLWVCWWNKNRHHDEKNLPPDLEVFCLISGMELCEWMNRHKDWWVVGEWDDQRYASPVRLTDAGHCALADRSKYDMEPVTGGLAEPGWEVIPAPRRKKIAKV